MVIGMVNIIRGVLLGLTLLLGVTAQFDEEEKDYRGQFIGSLNSYHHQVTVATHHHSRPGNGKLSDISPLWVACILSMA